MKKKILMVLCAICLVIPCMIGLTACGTHEHQFNEEWTINATHHWHQCEKCDEKQDYEEHDWDSGVITSPATPIEDGVKLFICQDCNASRIESIEYEIVKTVNESEWNSALNLGVKDKFKLNMGTQLATKDGDILCVAQTEETKYYSKEGNKYYLYSTAGDWVKTEIQESEYNYYVTEYYNFNGLYEYSTFDYNISTQKYESSETALSFENGKLVSITSGAINITVSYDNINLTLPEVA